MNTASVDVQMNMIWLFVIHILLDNRDSVFGRTDILFHWHKLGSGEHSAFYPTDSSVAVSPTVKWQGLNRIT
jgi:hypothetical protein